MQLSDRPSPSCTQMLRLTLQHANDVLLLKDSIKLNHQIEPNDNIKEKKRKTNKNTKYFKKNKQTMFFFLPNFSNNKSTQW